MERQIQEVASNTVDGSANEARHIGNLVADIMGGIIPPDATHPGATRGNDWAGSSGNRASPAIQWKGDTGLRKKRGGARSPAKEACVSGAGLGIHAAWPDCQGSMRSSAAMSDSLKSAMRSCRQPVVRIMWIAKDLAGDRLSLKISEA